MAIRFEHSGNAAATTLSTSISNVSTTINIASATGWPTGAVGPFWVTVDAGTAAEERALVLSRTGTALTVSARGADGTTATSHASGAAIIHTFSATEADDANALAAQVTTSGGTVVTTTSIPATVVTTTGAQSVASKTFTGANFDVQTGHRNVIRNGDMGIYQRNGTTWANNTVGVDGWLYSATGGTAASTRPSTVVGAGFGANGAGFALQSVVSGQAAAGDFAQYTARVEGVRTLAGRTATLSFLANAGSGTPKVGLEIVQSFGTGGSPSATVFTTISAVTLSTSAVQYTATFTVPSISGKTLGTAGDDYLAVNLWTSAGTTFNARASSIGVQAATIIITDVQLEAGSAATPFERLPQQVQLAWCQRYFARVGGNAAGNVLPIANAMVVVNTSSAHAVVTMPVPMRVGPTFALGSTVGNFDLQTNAAGSSVCTAITSGNTPSPTAVILSCTAAATLVVGNATMLRGIGSSGSYLDFSAEL